MLHRVTRVMQPNFFSVPFDRFAGFGFYKSFWKVHKSADQYRSVFHDQSYFFCTSIHVKSFDAHSISIYIIINRYTLKEEERRSDYEFSNLSVTMQRPGKIRPCIQLVHNYTKQSSKILLWYISLHCNFIKYWALSCQGTCHSCSNYSFF